MKKIITLFWLSFLCFVSCNYYLNDEKSFEPQSYEKRSFSVWSYKNYEWVQMQFNLLAVGKHCNIWVNDKCISPTKKTYRAYTIYPEQAKKEADDFDLIYILQSNVLGFDYSNRQGNDGDSRITILYYNPDSAFLAGTFSAPNTINLGLTNGGTASTSTKIHEFQHFITYNMKGTNNPSWYTELLSEMAQHVILPMVNSHSTKYNYEDIREYYNLDDIPQGIGMTSDYKMWSIFGEYLLSNYGGTELLKRILANAETGNESITIALNETYHGITLEEVLSRFGESYNINRTK